MAFFAYLQERILITLLEHIDNLSKYVTDNKDETLQAILENNKIMDDDSLLVYFIETSSIGNTMMIMYTDGDGKKIWKWIQDVSIQNNCKRLYCITQRHQSICRKYKFKPVGVLCEREGFTQWEKQ